MTAASPEGVPIPFPDAKLALAAIPPQAWETLVADSQVLARQAELHGAQFFAQAREAAERGDWAAITRLMEEAKSRFAGHPWIMEVLAGLAELAQMRDQARFSKEALDSSRRMASRLSAKDELMFGTVAEATNPSFLRRKKQQGKSEFDKGPDDQNR